jgi:hypothetical protein
MQKPAFLLKIGSFLQKCKNISLPASGNNKNAKKSSSVFPVV